MAKASKASVAKARSEAEKADTKDKPRGHKRIQVYFRGMFRRRRVFKYARYELQTDGVTTVLRIFEASTNTEHMYPFEDIKEVRT